MGFDSQSSRESTKIPVPQNGLCQWWLSLGFSQRLWYKLERNPWESSTIRSIISALDPRNHHRVRTCRHLDCRCILLRSSQASWSRRTLLSPSHMYTWTVCTLKMEIDDTNNMFLLFPCFSSQSTNNHCSKKERFHLDIISSLEVVIAVHLWSLATSPRRMFIITSKSGNYSKSWSSEVWRCEIIHQALWIQQKKT